MRPLRKLPFLATALIATYTAHADTRTWQTAGTTDTWSTAAGDTNWFIDANTTLSPWADANAAVFDAATGETITKTGTLLPATVTIGANNGNWAFSGTGTIGGAASVLKTGTGSLSLTTDNAFSGGLTISQGTVNFSTANATGTGLITLNDANTGATNNSLLGTIATARAITVANAGTGITTIGTTSGGAIAFSGALTLDKAVTLQAGTTDRTDFSGTMSGAGDITISAGVTNGRVIFNGTAKTATSNVTITSGANLQLSDGTATANSFVGDASLVTVNTGGLLRIAKGGNNETIGGLAGGGKVQAFFSNNTLTIGGTGTNTFTGELENNSGTLSLTKSGTGTQTLGGTGTSNFSGNVSITGGILKLAKSTALGAANTAVTKTIVAAGATLDVNGSNDTSYGVTIAGTGTSGQGALVNTGAATGAGNIQTPNIALSANATIGGTGNFYMIASGYGANTLTLNSNTLTKAGTNTFFLTNTTVTAGTIAISGGSISQNRASNGSAAAFVLDNTAGVSLALGGYDLSIGSLAGGGATGGNVNLGGNTLATGALGTSNTFSGAISGTGNLTKTGAGTLTLAGINTWSGATTINSGTLQAGSTGAIGANSAVTVANIAGATLDLNGFSLQVGSLAGGGVTGGTVTNSSGTPAVLTTGGLNASPTFAGAITGTTLGLTKAGTGTLTLSGTNTYGGTTTVSGGKLLVTGTLASSGNVSVGNGAIFAGSGSAGAVTVAAGGIIEGGNSGTGSLTLASLSFTDAAAVNIGPLTGYASTAAVHVTGTVAASAAPAAVVLNLPAGGIASGTYHLISHANTLTDLSAFTLGTAPTLSNRQSGMLVNNTGSIDYVVAGDTPKWTGLDGSDWVVGGTVPLHNWKLISAGTATDYIEGDLVLFDDTAANKNVRISLADISPAAVTFNNSAGNDYVLSGADYTTSMEMWGITGGTTLTKSGSGMLTLTGRNTFNGGITLSAGTINANHPSALGTGPLTFAGGAIDNTTGAPLALTTANALQGGDIVFTGSNDLTLDGPLAMSVNRQVIANNGVLTLSGVVSGTGFSLTKAGPGTLVLSGTNTHTGGTLVTAGTLRPTASTAFGGGAVTLNGGTLDPNALALTTPITVGAAGGAVAGHGTLSGIISGSGALSLASDGTLTVGAINTWSGGSTVTAGTVTLSTSATFGFTNGSVGSGPLTINSGATVNTTTFFTIDGNNTASARTVNVAGTLNLGGSEYLRTINLTGGTLNAPGTGTEYLRAPGTGLAINSLASATTSTLANRLDLTFSPLVVDTANGAAAVDLAITGTVTENTGAGTGAKTITKNGTGTLLLSGANTYSGGTTVNAGALLVNNATGSGTGSGAVTITSGATLTGTGTISGAVTVNGSLVPGQGLGGISTGALTLAATSSADFELDTTAVTSDVVHVTGNVTLGGALNLTDLAPASLSNTAKLTLLTYTGTLTGTFAGLAEGATVTVSGNPLFIHYHDGNAVTLSMGDAYTNWASTHGLTGPDAARDADPDHDGVKNALEFLFGAEPNPANAGAGSLAALPSITTDATALHFTYRRTAASVGVVSPVVQYGSTLTGWTNAVDGVNGVTVQVVTDGFGTGVDRVTVNIPLTLGSGGKLFARLTVPNP